VITVATTTFDSDTIMRITPTMEASHHSGTSEFERAEYPVRRALHSHRSISERLVLDWRGLSVGLCFAFRQRGMSNWPSAEIRFHTSAAAGEAAS
jgi:hypothetical protein